MNQRMDDLSTSVVLFTIAGSLAKRGSVKANTKKKSTLCLVQTKASDLADFPGVNAP